jgi:hypothetical protein
VKDVVFTFRTQMPDEVSPDQIHEIAIGAFAQIQDPENAPDPITVTTEVTVNGSRLVSDASGSRVELTYDEKCAMATADQGLDPVIATLNSAGIDHELQQTGGFCMVVTASVPDGMLGITQSDDSSVMYMVCFYPGDTWEEGSEESAVHYRRIEDLTTLVHRYKERQWGTLAKEDK